MGTKQFDNYADLITFTRASSATYLDSDGVLKTASTNTPRIEYDADGNRLGLLVEEQRTNLVTYSEDYSTGQWSNRNVTLTTGQASPDGQNSATLVTSSTTDGSNGLNLTGFSGSTGLTYACFAKKGSTNWLSINPVAGVVAYFDLDNGVKGTATGCVSEIQDVGNGWYRCSAYLAGAFGNNGRLVVSDSDNTSNSASGNSIYIWGAQLEAGAFPTSYIATSGSTATRAADVASIPTSAFGYNASEGTVVVEFSKYGIDTAGPAAYVFGLAGNLRAPQATFGMRWYSPGGGNVALGSVSINTNEKVAVSIKAGELDAISRNGGSILNSDNVFNPSGSPTDLFLGRVPSVSSPQLDGHIKSIKYYPRRLSDAQLQELTQ